MKNLFKLALVLSSVLVTYLAVAEDKVPAKPAASAEAASVAAEKNLLIKLFKMYVPPATHPMAIV